MPIRTCRLHLRYGSGYTGTGAYVQKLKDVFNALNSDIRFVEASSVAVPVATLASVNVGTCTTVTAELNALYAAAPTPLGSDDITVFFAEVLTGGSTWGCARHPSGCRGVIISRAARPIVLAHEVAHLFLGLGHITSDQHNLMWADSDAIKEPVVLTTFQQKKLRKGAWAMIATPPPMPTLATTKYQPAGAAEAPPSSSKARKRATKPRKKRTPKRPAAERGGVPASRSNGRRRTARKRRSRSTPTR